MRAVKSLVGEEPRTHRPGPGSWPLLRPPFLLRMVLHLPLRGLPSGGAGLRAGTLRALPGPQGTRASDTMAPSCRRRREPWFCPWLPLCRQRTRRWFHSLVPSSRQSCEACMPSPLSGKKLELMGSQAGLLNMTVGRDGARVLTQVAPLCRPHPRRCTTRDTTALPAAAPSTISGKSGDGGSDQGPSPQMSSESPSPWLSGAQAQRRATGQDGLRGGGGNRAPALSRSRRPAVHAPAVLTSPGGDADRAHN